jgi:N utilization substance protein A
VSGVYLEDDPDSGRTAVVIVPDDQLSLAIGREGQNARLAAKLTGWRIDIKSVSEAVQDALSRLDVEPLSQLRDEQPELVAEIERIMEKKAANRTVMPEEYQLLAKFADQAETLLLEERDKARRERLAEISAVRATLPQRTFKMPIDTLGLPPEITNALEPLGSVGEIMLRFLVDEGRLRELLQGLPEDALLRVQEALDNLVLPELEVGQPEVAETEAPAVAEEPTVAEVEVEEAVAAEESAEEVPQFSEEEIIIEEAPAVTQPEVFVGRGAERGREYEEDFWEEDEEELDELLLQDEAKRDKKGRKKKKKERQQRRHLIYDEDTGMVVAKRRRKRRGTHDLDDWDDITWS